MSSLRASKSNTTRRVEGRAQPSIWQPAATSGKKLLSGNGQISARRASPCRAEVRRRPRLWDNVKTNKVEQAHARQENQRRPPHPLRLWEAAEARPFSGMKLLSLDYPYA